MKRTDSSDVPVLVELLEGTTVRASDIFEPGTGFTTHSLTLTQSEINSITDWGNLAVRVTAGVPDETGLEDCIVDWFIDADATTLENHTWVPVQSAWVTRFPVSE